MASQAFADQPFVWPKVFAWWHSPLAQRRWLCGGVSAMVHLVLLGFAALLGYSPPNHDDLPHVDSAWTLDEPLTDLAEETITLTEFSSLDPGGREIDGDLFGEHDTATTPDVMRFSELATSPAPLIDAAWHGSELISPVDKPRRSTGRGQGRGDGTGDGASFFGIPVSSARRIVYVVDNSVSMNHPYESPDSPAKTRFNRVKMELVKSIWLMHPEQEFFVIFFNRDSEPMPSRTMVRATWPAKEHFLTWVAETKTFGNPTDPRDAMQLALSFRPDIIYFLTDGEFAKGVNGSLLKIRQPQTAIHTFSLGENLNEAALTDIAKNNQGKYTYIP